MCSIDNVEHMCITNVQGSCRKARYIHSWHAQIDQYDTDDAADDTDHDDVAVTVVYDDIDMMMT
jgi:hypothetical protein